MRGVYLSFMMLALALSFVACSKDDDDEVIVSFF